MSTKRLRKHHDAGQNAMQAQLERLQAANLRLQEEIGLRLEAEERWTEERALLRSIIDLLPDYLFVKDAKGRFVFANKATAEGIGFADAERLIGRTDVELLPGETGRRILADDLAVIASGRPMMDFEEPHVNAAGIGTWLSTTKVPMRDKQGRVTGIVGRCQDIGERKRLEMLRLEQARLLEMIASNASLEDVLLSLTHVIERQQEGCLASILLLDTDGQTLRHGAAPNLPEDYCKLVDGVRIGPKVGSCGTAAYRRAPVIVSDIQSDPLWEDVKGLVAPYGFRSCWSAPILSHLGEVLGTFALYSFQVREPTQAELCVVDMAAHIAGIAIERRRSEERIHHMAHHDALTGLPNRTLLNDRLAQAILFAQEDGRQVTVAFIDLDGFKLINDGLGHSAGDDLLKVVADRMKRCARPVDTVVRLGGDEFVIMFHDQPADAKFRGETLPAVLATLSEPITIDGQVLQVTCSAGIATYPVDGRDVETLLMNADAAMYRAKELGRNNFQFFTAELNQQIQERLALQDGLRKAIERDEFSLVYQPQVEIRSGRIFAVEALIRWQHPELGIVSPAKFIPVAEETGLIVQIGDWVLRTACRQNRLWQETGAPPIVMSVNVSARQFMDRTWIHRVAQALNDSGLSAQYLELELTESLIMQDVQKAVATMWELQAMGIKLSIDDFGTGYSSLNSLKSFPVGRLKIDQSFVRDLANNDDDNAIASAVISLGHKLNLKVIAEGVETEKQLAFLRDNHCDEMQGYQFSKPVPAGEIEAMLKAQVGA